MASPRLGPHIPLTGLAETAGILGGSVVGHAACCCLLPLGGVASEESLPLQGEAVQERHSHPGCPPFVQQGQVLEARRLTYHHVHLL